MSGGDQLSIFDTVTGQGVPRGDFHIHTAWTDGARLSWLKLKGSGRLLATCELDTRGGFDPEVTVVGSAWLIRCFIGLRRSDIPQRIQVFE